MDSCTLCMFINHLRSFEPELSEIIKKIVDLQIEDLEESIVYSVEYMNIHSVNTAIEEVGYDVSSLDCYSAVQSQQSQCLSTVFIDYTKELLGTISELCQENRGFSIEKIVELLEKKILSEINDE